MEGLHPRKNLTIEGTKVLFLPSKFSGGEIFADAIVRKDLSSPLWYFSIRTELLDESKLTLEIKLLYIKKPRFYYIHMKNIDSKFIK